MKKKIVLEGEEAEWFESFVMEWANKIEAKTAERPYYEFGAWNCKCCGNMVETDDSFCRCCGRAIDWSE